MFSIWFSYIYLHALGQKKVLILPFQLPCLENKTKKGLRIYELDLNFKMKLKLYYLLYIIEFKIQHRPPVGFFTSVQMYNSYWANPVMLQIQKKNQDKLKDIFFFKNSNHDQLRLYSLSIDHVSTLCDHLVTSPFEQNFRTTR